MGRKGEGKSLKRTCAPRQWKIHRKERIWTIKNIPGPHSSELSVPITFILRDYLGYAKNVREVKKILNDGLVVINGKTRKDYRYPVGLMDIVEIPRMEEYYRVVPNYKGNLILHPISKEEKDIKLCKIRDVTTITSGKYQLSFHDGNNMISDKKFNTYESVLLDLSTNKIVEEIPLKKGNLVLIISGKNVSRIGKIVEVRDFGMNPDTVTLESSEGTFQTLKDYVIAVGRDNNPMISLPAGD
ncbi:MAG: 30S ribosomal protein S4e [Candidatus Methanofastidiosia archaeon]